MGAEERGVSSRRDGRGASEQGVHPFCVGGCGGEDISCACGGGIVGAVCWVEFSVFAIRVSVRVVVVSLSDVEIPIECCLQVKPRIVHPEWVPDIHPEELLER